MVDNADQQRELIAAAMRVYTPAMRRYITRRLDDALGPDWYEAWLRASLKLQLPPPVHKQYRDRLATTERGGRAPEVALDPDEFPYVIRDHSELFSNEINALRQEMRNISKDGTLPQERTAAAAQRQAQRLLTNCDTVLRVVDEKAARRLPRLPDTDDSDSVRDNEDSVRDARREEAPEAVRTRAIDGRHRDDRDVRVQTRDTDGIADEGIEHNALLEVTIGTLPLSSDLRFVMTKILDQYREGMQRYISSVLGKPSAFGPGWIQNVANVAGPDKARMEQEIKKGTPAHEIIDVGNFPHIISKFGDHFPGNLLSDQYLQRMEWINKRGRRGWAHKSATRRRNVEEIAQACFLVLTETRFELAADAAYEITKYFESDTRSRLNDAGSGHVQAEEERPKVESAGREGDQVPLPGGSETDPERRKQRPDESPRLEAAAATGQLGHEQRALADAGEARRIASSTQGGPSDGGGGSGAATLAGTGDDDRSPPANENGDRQEPGKRGHLPSRAATMKTAKMIVDVVAIAIAVYLIVAALPGGSPPAVAPAIDGIINCEPTSPMVGEAVSCHADLSGGEPDSWFWSVNRTPTSQSWNRGDPPYGDRPSFKTMFSSRGSYELTLTVANDADDVSKSFNIKVLPPRPTIKRLACSPENPAVYEPTVREPIICTAPLGGGEPDSWTWSGGDDPPLGDKTEFITVFSSPGSREITLTVENETDSDSRRLEIEVLPLPPTIGKPKCSPPTPKVGDQIRCAAPLSGGEPDSWTWSGGGDPGSQSWSRGDPPYDDPPSFETTFSSSGSYEITLTVKNAGGGNSAVVKVQVQKPMPSEDDGTAPGGDGTTGGGDDGSSAGGRAGTGEGGGTAPDDDETTGDGDDGSDTGDGMEGMGEDDRSSTGSGMEGMGEDDRSSTGSGMEGMGEDGGMEPAGGGTTDGEESEDEVDSTGEGGMETVDAQ